MSRQTTDQILESIQFKFKCRNVQIRQLFHYLNLSDAKNIVMYGPRSTCKTSIAKELIDQFDLFHAWIDVIQHTNNRSLYENILMQIRKKIPSNEEEEDEWNNIKCINSIVFIEKLESMLKSYARVAHRGDVYETKFYVFLDNFSSILKQDNAEFIFLMNKLEELVKKAYPVSVIYIGNSSLESIVKQSDFKFSSLQVIFNNYSNDELLQLLSSRPLLNMDYSDEFYHNYVNIILRSLFPLTRNFTELQTVCLRYLDTYVKPIEEDEVTSKDYGKLYLKFQPALQEIIENFSDHKVVRLKAFIEMSPSMSYLMIAAYLASYNPAKSDKKYFVRNQGKVRTDRRSQLRREPETDKSPKPFTFERVFNIYQSLLNLNETNEISRRHLFISSIVLQQFNELIKQNLIFAMNASNNSISSVAKYQISDLVTFKNIEDISFRINLNLSAFLDF